MHAQLITYRLTDVSREHVQEDLIRPYAKYFADLDGLVSKVWLDDTAAGNYGGFYVWNDKAAMDKFMSSPAAADIIGQPYIVDLASADWPIEEDASRTTRGVSH